jgi:hypothetical protein
LSLSLSHFATFNFSLLNKENGKRVYIIYYRNTVKNVKMISFVYIQTKFIYINMFFFYHSVIASIVNFQLSASYVVRFNLFFILILE